MAEVRAADLPDGTIVAGRNPHGRAVAHLKYGPDNWGSTDGNRPRDTAIDADLARGATVVRHGYGENAP